MSKGVKITIIVVVLVAIVGVAVYFVCNKKDEKDGTDKPAVKTDDTAPVKEKTTGDKVIETIHGVTDIADTWVA